MYKTMNLANNCEASEDDLSV